MEEGVGSNTPAGPLERPAVQHWEMPPDPRKAEYYLTTSYTFYKVFTLQTVGSHWHAIVKGMHTLTHTVRKIASTTQD